MILKELIQLREGKMKDKHTDLLDAIADEYGCDDEMCELIAKYLHDKTSQKEEEQVQDFLMAHYEMDKVGGDRDMSNALADKVSAKFRKYL